MSELTNPYTIHPMNYAQGLHFIFFCDCLFMFYFPHNHKGYFTGNGAILLLPQCQWSNPEE